MSQLFMLCQVQCDLTRWMPLRPYPGSEADLQTKSEAEKRKYISMISV